MRQTTDMASAQIVCILAFNEVKVAEIFEYYT